MERKVGMRRRWIVSAHPKPNVHVARRKRSSVHAAGPRAKIRLWAPDVVVVPVQPAPVPVSAPARKIRSLRGSCVVVGLGLLMHALVKKPSTVVYFLPRRILLRGVRWRVSLVGLFKGFLMGSSKSLFPCTVAFAL